MPEIRIEHLHYRYPPFDPNEPHPDQNWVLEDVTLNIEVGEFLGILGTTGSGKSTLCLSLTGLVPQQTSGTIRGDVWIGDVNTKRQPVAKTAAVVGIVFQDPEANFLGLTVEDEVAFGLENLGVERSEILERVDWALDLVGMSDHRLRTVARLSGGQKQRVAIASVLAMTPEVLVLDDPTAELDPAGTADVLGVLDAVRLRQPGTTIVMTSGDAGPLAAGADRIAVLDQGSLVALDTADKLFSTPSRLLDLGVAVPPTGELAAELNARLGTAFDFYMIDQAADALRSSLSE